MLETSLLFNSQESAYILHYLLAYLCIETSQFPDSWKVARITPIFKDGDRAEKSNYRPISVLPVISKLFEKLVFNQLYQYMKENGLFTSDQSGFLRLHSTLTCLLKMSDDWYNGLDLSKLVGLVFINLKKAVDTVDHDILCKSSNFMVFNSENCLGLGLTYRTANNVGEIEVGVPQGSCLGPLLFLIYINDLPQTVQGSSVTMYADDTSLCHQSHDLTQLNEAINSDLMKLETWLQGNKLSLNVAKTHSMLLSTKQKHNSQKSK